MQRSAWVKKKTKKHLRVVKYDTFHPCFVFISIDFLNSVHNYFVVLDILPQATQTPASCMSTFSHHYLPCPRKNIYFCKGQNLQLCIHFKIELIFKWYHGLKSVTIMKTVYICYSIHSNNTLRILRVWFLIGVYTWKEYTVQFFNIASTKQWLLYNVMICMLNLKYNWQTLSECLCQSDV